MKLLNRLVRNKLAFCIVYNRTWYCRSLTNLEYGIASLYFFVSFFVNVLCCVKLIGAW